MASPDCPRSGYDQRGAPRDMGGTGIMSGHGLCGECGLKFLFEAAATVVCGGDAQWGYRFDDDRDRGNYVDGGGVASVVVIDVQTGVARPA